MPMTLEQMEEMLEKQAKALEALTTGQTSLVSSLTSFQKDVGNAIKSQQQESAAALNRALEAIADKKDDGGSSSRKPPSYDDSDLEAMPRSEFMKVIMSEISGSLKEEFDNIRSEINSGREESARDRVEREYKELKSGDAKDIDEWRDELKIAVKKNPLLSVRDAYLLVKAGNPDKAKELNEKYAEKPKNDDGEKSKRGGEGGFGGMRPGSGNRSEQHSDMTNQESSEKAWDDIFGGREQELLNGDIPITADDKAA